MAAADRVQTSQLPPPLPARPRPRRVPTFADLLRLRDARRERLLDRRAQLSEQARPADGSSSTARKGKGAASSGKGADVGAGPGPPDSSGRTADQQDWPAPLAGLAGELASSIQREARLRCALLGLPPAAATAATAVAGSRSDPGDGRQSLRPMPGFLLRADLQEHLEALERSIPSSSSSDADAVGGAAGSGAKSEFSSAWLLARCQDITGASDAATVCDEVLALLRSGRSDDDVQAPLLELVGYDNMEFLGSLVSRRADIVRAVDDEADRARAAAVRSARALPGVQAVVRTERDVALDKELSKARRRRKGGAAEDRAPAAGPPLESGEELRRAREKQLTRRPKEALRPESHGAAQYPFVFTSGPAGGAGGAMLSMFGTKYALPAGTARDEFADHEEITIPVMRTAPRRDTEQP
ncbi:putative steryl acetyl hydrolase mug81, partial [Coemansia helicoidea]